VSYDLQALLGKRDALQSHAAAFSSARVVSLTNGIAMIPMTNELFEEIGGDGVVDKFYKFSTAVEDWARRISEDSPIAYVEAEYFGGVGGQNSVAWVRGLRVLEPVHAADAINQALKILGVSAAGFAGDEFDAVGLGKYRETESWLENRDGNNAD